MSNSINISQLMTVAKALQDVRDQVVFVGGSTTVLLIDSVDSGKARQTEDVDFIIDIAFNTDMAKFEDKMRSLGFANDQSKGAPLCRWLIPFMGDTYLKVDAMPADANVLGFTNTWYPDVIKTCWEYTLQDKDEKLPIKVVDPIYFLGTKFEAYHGRGNGDIFSHDMEDIFFVLEHRSGIEMLAYEADTSIQGYLASEFRNLLDHPDLDNTIQGFLDDPQAVDEVYAKMIFISAL